MSVTCSPNFSLTAIETIETGVDSVQQPILTHNGFNFSGTTLNATSTPAISKASYNRYALVAGAKTVDLAALAGSGGVTIDGSGLKVQAFIFRNRGAAAMTISEGASNGYALFGASGGPVKVGPGGCIAFYQPEYLADVAAGDKTIDIAGTGTEEFDFGILLG